MKKIYMFIVLLIMVCTISTISYAKGTVSGSGTEEDPYKLVLGESIIDIYYAEGKAETNNPEKYSNFYFQFTGGSVNAANYMVDHNSDKHRVRFTLIGNTDDDLAVTAARGINYIQAGAICRIPDIDDLNKGATTATEAIDNAVEGKVEGELNDIQTPYYKITSTETFTSVNSQYNGKPLVHEVDLGNGYIKVDNVLASNVSNYATSYIFSKSNLDYNTAYRITDEQISKNAKLLFANHGTNSRLQSKNVVRIIQGEYILDHNLSGPVKVIYYFGGTNSKVQDSDGEPASFVEKLISKIFISVGDAFVTITNLGGVRGSNAEEKIENLIGEDNPFTMYVTLDSLVFNEYPKTIVDLWGDTGSTNGLAKNVVNFWYKVFQAWAIIIYIILLIYMGIKTVLYTGMPEQKNIKQMLEGWLLGVLMLFCLPFLFKYMITINDVMVDIIRTNSKYSVYAYYTFEDQYETLGGLEDGEDSTTDIVAKLTQAKNALIEEIEELESYVDAFDDGYQDAKQEAEKYKNQKRQTEEAVQKGLVDIENLYNGKGYEIRKDGVKIDSTQMSSEMWALVDKYYSENVNFDGEDFSEEFSDGLYALADEYASHFIIYDPATGKEAVASAGTINGLNWFTYWLRDEISGTIIGNMSSSDIYIEDDNGNMVQNPDAIKAGSINDVYEAEEWVKYYETEKKKYEKEKAAKEEKLAGVEMAIAKAQENDVDLIGEMRTKAGDTLRFIYVLVWLILIFETILLLIIYYKRLFMIVVLISVFPLVTVAYAFEKSQGTSASVLKNWFQEYTLNVFIQTIHAILYVTLVEIGYSVYIANNDSWIIFIFAVVSMITAEPIFKNIIGLKGNTVSNLGSYAKASLGVTGAALAIGGMVTKTYGDMKGIDRAAKNKEATIEKKNKEADRRKATERLEEENDIKKKYGVDSERTRRMLEEKKKREEEEDKKTAEERKRAANKRKRAARAKMVHRAEGNLLGATVATSAALAAGGDLSDFVTSEGVVSALGGIGNGKNTKLTDEAQERLDRIANEKDNVTAENKVGNVTTENANDGGRSGNYSGPGYDDYSYESSGSGGEGPVVENNSTVSDFIRHPINTIKTNHASLLKSEFRRKLDEEKVYSEKRWNINEEDE